MSTLFEERIKFIEKKKIKFQKKIEGKNFEIKYNEQKIRVIQKSKCQSDEKKEKVESTLAKIKRMQMQVENLYEQFEYINEQQYYYFNMIHKNRENV